MTDVKYEECFDLDFSLQSRKARFSYVYTLCYPDGTPFYVGVGTRSRYASHFSPSAKGENPMKDNIINKICSSTGGKVKVNMIAISDDRDNMLELEKYLISLYGRRDNGTGILSNMTDGGDGRCGFIMKEEQKEQLRKRIPYNKGKKYSKSFREKVSKGLKKHYQNMREQGITISPHKKGSVTSEETKRKQSLVRKGVPKSTSHVKNQAFSNALTKPDYLVYIKGLDIWYYVVYAAEFCKSLCCPTNHTSVLRRSASGGNKLRSGIIAYRVPLSFRKEDKSFYPMSKKQALSIVNVVRTA